MISSYQTHKKSSANVELAEKYRGRAEVITLAQKHIEELEMMEKKRFNDKVNSERSALMSGAISIKIDPTAAALSRNNNSSNYTSDLPPIDDDPEITSGLKDLNAQNNDLV